VAIAHLLLHLLLVLLLLVLLVRGQQVRVQVLMGGVRKDTWRIAG
jgi:hypothetical protein